MFCFLKKFVPITAFCPLFTKTQTKMKVPNQDGYGIKDNLTIEYKFRKQTHRHSQTSAESFLLLVTYNTIQLFYITMVHKFLYFLLDIPHLQSYCIQWALILAYGALRIFRLKQVTYIMIPVSKKVHEYIYIDDWSTPK